MSLLHVRAGFRSISSARVLRPATCACSGTSARRGRTGFMTKSDDDAAKVERGESVFSPVPVCIMIGGGFATLLMAKSAFDLLIRYGGL